MEESRIIKMINNNPSIISTINNPTDEMKLLAIKKDGLTLEYIDNPTIEMQELALDNNIRAIRYIDNPTEEMMIKAVNAGWSILDYIKNPTDIEDGTIEAPENFLGPETLYNGSTINSSDHGFGSYTYPDRKEENGNSWIGRPLLMGSYYVKELSRSECLFSVGI